MSDRTGKSHTGAPVPARRVFIATGVSHSGACQTVRDAAAFTSAKAAALRADLAALGVEGAVILSTCNRSEVFLCTPEAAAAAVVRAYAALFPAAAESGDIVLRTGAEAVAYFFRIASGMESMVFGEYQILGQVRAACAEARAAGVVAGRLDRILRDAVTCARAVRTELDLGAVAPSVCRAAIDRADALGGISGKRVFVIGSGRTGSLAAELAVGRGASSITVCNRSPERAAHLVRSLGARAVPYEERYDAIAASDTVVSATASPHIVVSRERVSLAHPVLFVDLASPRDVDPAIASDPLATLVDLDAIGALVSGDSDERTHLESRAGEIVKAAVDETMSALEALS